MGDRGQNSFLKKLRNKIIKRKKSREIKRLLLKSFLLTTITFGELILGIVVTLVQKPRKVPTCES